MHTMAWPLSRDGPRYRARPLGLHGAVRRLPLGSARDGVVRMEDLARIILVRSAMGRRGDVLGESAGVQPHAFGSARSLMAGVGVWRKARTGCQLLITRPGI